MKAPRSARRVADAVRIGAPLTAVAAACALFLAGDSRADDPRAGDPRAGRAIGYDHVWHEGQVSVAGQSAIPCERCHPIASSGQLRGRPDHASCYGGCHGPAPRRRVLGRPYPIADERMRQCRTCHTEQALKGVTQGGRRAVTVAYPPYRRDPDHGVQMSHAAHDRAARAQPDDCAICHAQVSAVSVAPSDPHVRCAGCHGRAVDALTGGAGDPSTGSARMAPMTACSTCHQQAYGPGADPTVVPGTYPVTRTFSHRRHASRQPLSCRQCHATIAAAEGAELPAPTMDSCAACHDGQRAFATTGPSCRRCHTARSGNLQIRPDRLVRFSHTDHKVAAADCQTCHKLDDAGIPLPTSADHQPCASAGCHREQFGSLEPTICTTCHLGTEPWRGLHFDRPPPAATEFGARFSHRRHLGISGVDKTCRGCHRRAERDRHLRLPRNHDSCQGSGCHRNPDRASRGGGPAPALNQCRACHVADLLEGRERRRRAAKWSVRARFRHDVHERDPRTREPVACTDCHLGLAAADVIDAVPTPNKRVCQKCHDGQIAFKVTGHGCARCHGARTGPSEER